MADIDKSLQESAHKAEALTDENPAQETEIQESKAAPVQSERMDDEAFIDSLIGSDEPSTPEAKKEAAKQEDPEGGDPGPASYKLTNEEEILLRRQKLSEEERDAIAALPEAQRKLTLKSIHANQDLLDRIYGMPPAERESILGASKKAAGTTGRDDKPEDDELTRRIAGLLTPSEDEVVAHERELDLDAGSLRKYEDARAKRTAAVIAQILRSQSQEVLEQTATVTRAKLAKAFPMLESEATWASVVEDPLTIGAFQAMVRSGTSIPQAFATVVTQRAKGLAYDEFQRTKQKQEAGKRALKGTSEPAAFGRSPGKPPRRTPTTDEEFVQSLIDGDD